MGKYCVQHLSHSSVTTYTSCARSWKYSYLQKVKTPSAPALMFGSAFHDAVEGYLVDLDMCEGKDITPLTERWRHAWGAQVSEAGEVDWGVSTEKEFLNLGLKMLKRQGIVAAIEDIMLFGGDDVPIADVVERKVEFTVPGVPVPVIGYIDVIDEDGVPIDLKTASRAWNAGREHDELQPAFYIAALDQGGWEHNPKSLFRYYIFTKTKSPEVYVLETSRSRADIQWCFGLIQDVWDGIENEIFPPTGIGSWKCSPKWCGYWPLCRGRK